MISERRQMQFQIHAATIFSNKNNIYFRVCGAVPQPSFFH